MDKTSAYCWWWQAAFDINRKALRLWNTLFDNESEKCDRVNSILFLHSGTHIGIAFHSAHPESISWNGLSVSVITSTFPLYDTLDHTNHTFSESSWSKDI